MIPLSPGWRSLFRLNENIEPALARFPNVSMGRGAKFVSKSSDPIILETIRLIILALAWCNQNLDISLILVTHDIPMALEICKRSIILNGGKITTDDETYIILKDSNKMKENRLELPFGFALHLLDEWTSRDLM